MREQLQIKRLTADVVCLIILAIIPESRAIRNLSAEILSFFILPSHLNSKLIARKSLPMIAQVQISCHKTKRRTV